MSNNNSGVRINESIRVRQVRLVGEDGSQLGIKSVDDALKLAREAELDLVEVAPNADPPVARIMNYAKFRYEEEQRLKESRKKATNIVVKEMKYRLKIGPGDFETKTRKVAGFLKEGHKVKVTIMFRGREVERPQFGGQLLQKIADEVEDFAMVEMEARLDGRNMTMVLAPGKPKKEKAKSAVAPGSAPQAVAEPAAPADGEAPAEAEAAPEEAATES